MMNRLIEIKERYEKRLEPSDEDIKWLIEQVEKYQRVREKMIEQTIGNNYGALKRLDD